MEMFEVYSSPTKKNAPASGCIYKMEKGTPENLSSPRAIYYEARLSTVLHGKRRLMSSKEMR